MKKRKWKCGICGHIQDIEKTVCEYCGVDLLMSSNKKILVVEEPDPFDAEKARKEAEEARKRAEEERQRKEEARRRAEAERRKAEAERKREEEERRKAEAERKRAEEIRRKEEAARRQAEAERQKAEEERRRAEAERKGKERAEQLRREQEEKRLAQEAEKAAKEAEKQRKKEDQHKQKVQRKSKKKDEKSNKETDSPSVGNRIFKFLGIMLLIALVILVMLYIMGISSREEVDDDGNTISTGVFTENKVSGTCGNLVTWELDLDSGEMVISGSGEMYDFLPDGEVIPPMRDGNSAPPWIAYRDQINSVTVEDQVREIGNWAFAFCENLTTVHLGENVLRLENSAFAHSPVGSINLPDRLRFIGDNAFSGTMLTSISLPTSLEYLGRGAFEYCPDLKTVKVLGEKTRLNFDTWNGMLFSDANGDVFDLVLWGYTNSMVEEYARIKGIQFQSLGYGGWEATGECGEDLDWYLDLNTGFLKITGTGPMYDYIGAWMLEDEYWVNENSEWLSERELPPWDAYRGKIHAVSIGDEVTCIGENAFSMSNLVDVHIGSGVESVANMAFLETAVDQVVFPDSVKEIGPNAFNWCRNLTYVELPSELERLEESVFNQCRNLESLYVGRNTQLVDEAYTPFTQPDETYMPDNLTIYGLQSSDAERFASEHGIPFVIGYRGMRANYEGQCGDDAWWFVDEEKGTLVVYGTGSTWMYNLGMQDINNWAKSEYEAGRAFTSPPEFRTYNHFVSRIIVLPGLQALGNGLFRDMARVRSIDFGTVDECRSHMNGCSSLTEVVFPETTEYINSWLLYGCYNLERVTIPNGSRGVEPMLFYQCPNLISVTFGKDAKIMDTEEENLFSSNAYSFTPNPDLVFYVVQGSDAERYAKQYGIHYEHYES